LVPTSSQKEVAVAFLAYREVVGEEAFRAYLVGVVEAFLAFEVVEVAEALLPCLEEEVEEEAYQALVVVEVDAYQEVVGEEVELMALEEVVELMPLEEAVEVVEEEEAVVVLFLVVEVQLL
jgi:hypothetical protein